MFETVFRLAVRATTLTRSTALCLSLGLLVASGFPPPARAQDRDTPVELKETDFFGVGARALGMGMAYQTVGGDAAGLAYNPATLADIYRTQVSGGLAHGSTEWTLTRNASNTTEQSRTTMDHILAAFPMPTRTGNLTLGFGVYKMADLAQDVFLQSPLQGSGGGGNPELEEVDLLEQTGSLWAWTGGLGWDVSPAIAIGGSMSYLSGDRKQTTIVAHGYPSSAGDNFGLAYDCGQFGETDCFRDETYIDFDATGFTASFGLLGKVGENVRIGTTVYLPTWITYRGWVSNSYEDFIGPFPDTSLSIQDDITLPLSLAGGISLNGDLGLIAFDARWTDWSQIDFEGDVRAPDRRPAYKSTVELHMGGELAVPNTPLWLRAGAMLVPIPYRLIAADTQLVFDPGGDGQAGTGDDVSFVERQYPEADIGKDRWFVTLGLGVVFDDTLTLDLAYAWGSWERSSTGSYNPPYGNPTLESVRQDRLALTGAVHF